MNWRFAKSLQEEVLPEAMFEDSDLWDEKTEREMHAKIFVLPELLPLLQEAKARWRYINHGYQFRFRGGYVLCWWARTGSLTWQGHEKGEEEFLPSTKDVVSRVKEFVDIPYLGDVYPEEFPEPKKFSRRKPGKGEMQRRLEQERNDRGPTTREDDQSGGGGATGSTVGMHPADQMRVSEGGQCARHPAGTGFHRSLRDGDADDAYPASGRPGGEEPRD